ncbi:MAG TPA: hypothetical protein VMB91_10740 [Solirubrobacteraceae bacterium]|nr:hypothetical protein [Solirubrobacteraceae bacterium]
MARVVVTDDSGREVLLDEQVQAIHLATSHSSTQMLERVTWAVQDAERDREPGEGSESELRGRLKAA